MRRVRRQGPLRLQGEGNRLTGWAGLVGLKEAMEAVLFGNALLAAAAGFKVADPEGAGFTCPVKEKVQNADRGAVLPDFGRVIAALERRRAEKVHHLSRVQSGKRGRSGVEPRRGKGDPGFSFAIPGSTSRYSWFTRG